MSGRWRDGVRHGLVIASVLLLACSTPPAITRLTDARQHAAALRLQFTRASDATNRAVLATTDEASRAFAGEAVQARAAADAERAALAPVLESLQFTEERQQLDLAAERLTAYRELDDRILALAVENTNVKAQQLASGDAQVAADAVQHALDRLATGRAPSPVGWPVRALVAEALAGLREIQALQATHINAEDEASMQQTEMRMLAAEARARNALAELSVRAPVASEPAVAEARVAFDRFIEVQREILALSQRNTNVRSLALVLNQKGELTAACDDILKKLNDMLAARTLAGSR